MTRFYISVTLIAIVATLNSCIKSESCDLIIHNARIYSFDGSGEVHEAMAIKDGKILELGPERQILNKYRYDESYDAQLKPIYPGFIDAHCHFLGYGLSLQQAELKECNSFEEVLKTLVEFDKTRAGTWIEGRGWDHTKWKGSKYPNKKALDSLFPNTPVLIRRVDGHAALVNQKALDISGIDSSTHYPGGHIEILGGELTGILVDNAVDSVMKYIPTASEDQMKKALMDAQANCFEVGLTTVDDAGLQKNEVELIQHLQEVGLLKMRVYAMLTDNQENFDHYLKSGPIKTDRLNVRSFKFYGDGALGSRGACLLRPYEDAPGKYGMLINEEEYFRTWAQRVHNSGFQMNTHCIGDSAARLIMSIYGEILVKQNDFRWRIEHAQIINQADFDMFGKYSIIPSVQPTHATSDMRWAVLRVGRERLKYGYAYDQLRQQNGLVALGTDFPIEDISPIETFYAAVARKDKLGNPKTGFQTENALSREHALLGMTKWAATANFEEHEKGTLEKGKLADFVILDNDLMNCPEESILTTRIIRTYLNGECVYKN